MAWKQPQLSEPMMVSEEIGKLNRRLLLVFPKNSKAVSEGVQLHDVFDFATDRALRNIQAFMDGQFVQALGRKFVNAKPGELTYDTKIALGVIVLPPKAPTKLFVQQGVGYPAMGFLNPDPQVSYNESRQAGTAELLRLSLPLVGVPKVWNGYSQGADVVTNALLQWPADRRNEIKCIVQFGDPTRPAGPTLLGNDPGGSGIAGVFPPAWVLDRYFSFTQEGDMYPNAVGLLPQIYQILTRMEASADFALYLFRVLTSSFGGQLLGIAGSFIPGFGAFSGILTMITGGGILSNPAGSSDDINLLAMITNIPAIIQTLMAALKFIQTNAHMRYHDQPQPYWRGLTAVDCAAQIIQERVQSATVYTVPGTWASWNDGPPAWTAWKLP